MLTLSMDVIFYEMLLIRCNPVFHPSLSTGSNRGNILWHRHHRHHHHHITSRSSLSLSLFTVRRKAAQQEWNRLWTGGYPGTCGSLIPDSSRQHPTKSARRRAFSIIGIFAQKTAQKVLSRHPQLAIPDCFCPYLEPLSLTVMCLPAQYLLAGRSMWIR